MKFFFFCSVGLLLAEARLVLSHSPHRECMGAWENEQNQAPMIADLVLKPPAYF